MDEIQTNLPKHIGLITDGNRRWAREHDLPSLEGHRRGFDAVQKITDLAFELGIENFTVWAFSTENWNRSQEEVDYLMNLFESNLDTYYKKFNEKNARIRVVGQKWRLKTSFQEKIAKVEQETAAKTGMTINLAISYGGRDEIVQAIKNIHKQGIEAENITEQTISNNIWLPNVDLIIRAGGETRLSGFLMWQCQYAELIFVKKYLPDFSVEDFKACLAEFAGRRRRFGR